jgi:dTDP-4-dehydrorhamnose 3,5-epimerase
VPTPTVVPSRLEGPLLLEQPVFGDDRGFFAETYRRNQLAELGIVEEMVQDNHSRSRRGIVRGMHFHVGRGVSKLVRCARGTILDVLVDIRRGSPTYGEWERFELSDENMRMLYAPIGFAHGFVVTSDVADVIYKQDAYYAPDVEAGFAWDDPDVAIDWVLPADELQVSERDRQAPRLREIAGELPFAWTAATP